MQCNALKSSIPKRWKATCVKVNDVNGETKTYASKYDSFVNMKKPVRQFYCDVMRDPMALFTQYSKLQGKLHSDLSYKEFIQSIRNI